ncbi:MAG: bifunctional dihydroorotate dehydrogenase B NAD binding subunit/NADPH-dependent glutamate synthase [Bacteroidales bacterium]|jgi:glutamate synthase (NADPH/NADH) small chain|nr:bifunctional dihydroorotate dehydrogenase B NAD binding subunit/NADPH-dependent glutamate synthase [Bacteroidales bacterium]
MFEILDKVTLTENIFFVKVKAPWVARAAKPGQFVIVIIDEKGERIPLTICDFDKENGTIVLVFQKVGKSTNRMAELKVGESFRDIVGPLGKESEFLHYNKEELSQTKVLFVAGGVGTAPIFPQVKWFKQNGVPCDVIIGAKTKELVILEKELRPIAKNLYITTDDGSYGEKGLVTDVIERLITKENKHYDFVVAIGPMIMMKFVSLLTKKYNIKTIVSLNTLMVDGTGMCGACRVNVGGKTKFTCVDGPEFDGHLVDFDGAMKRQTMYYKNEVGKDTNEHKCNLTPMVDNSIKATNIEFNILKQVRVREQDPKIRATNFNEVSFGYNPQEAMIEAKRCIGCKKPLCVEGCPVRIKIPQFINEVKKGEFKEAFHILSQDTTLAAVCGRVCPQEEQCEQRCIMGKKGEAVAIGKLERFVADWARENGIKQETKIIRNNRKVAIVGSGPSGLTCGGDLAKMGYDVTIFEALHLSGGVLAYGIPEFRLPKKEVVEYEVENVKQLGVKIINDVVIGKSITVDELLDKENFEAVYIASGAGLPKFMNIEGENLNGVLSANEVLTRSNLMKAFEQGYDTPIYNGDRAVIVGGGNVAMDAARTIKRLGAETFLVYRRGEMEMPARKEEVHHAKEEGIIFHTMTNPTRIISDEKGWVKAIECVRMELGKEDESGRRSPIEIKGSEFIIETNCVVMALGTNPNPLIINTTKNLSSQKWGGIIADNKGQTSREGIFAGGDAVTGAATVILAMGAGRDAAKAINEYILQKNK